MKNCTLAPPANLTIEQEKIMLTGILEKAKAFYENPKNVQAFEAWKQNKEATKNEDYINTGRNT